jgi:hypothetical protein
LFLDQFEAALDQGGSEVAVMVGRSCLWLLGPLPPYCAHTNIVESKVDIVNVINYCLMLSRALRVGGVHDLKTEQTSIGPRLESICATKHPAGPYFPVSGHLTMR